MSGGGLRWLKSYFSLISYCLFSTFSTASLFSAPNIPEKIKRPIVLIGTVFLGEFAT